MFEFLLFGSMVWFWILFGVWSIVLMVSVEFDAPFWATGTTVLFLGVFGFFGVLPNGLGVLPFLAANPYYIALGAACFFVVGTVWAVVKWWFFVHSEAAKRREEISRNGSKKNLYGATVKKPIAKNNKSRIITWMCFWPFSLVWTIVDDPIRKIFEAIFSQIKVGLQKISDKAFEGLEEDDDDDDSAKPRKPRGLGFGLD